MSFNISIVVSLLMLVVPAAMAQSRSLEGTSWQLVKFQGGDGTTLTPDDRVMADGGIYGFEPFVSPKPKPEASSAGSAGHNRF